MSNSRSESSSEAVSERPVVLIVEDERDLADVYTAHLQEDYQVRTAYTGPEAIEYLDETVDVVLLDRRLPKASGRQVLDHLSEAGYDCRVAMVTGVDPDISVLDMEVDDYLVKPVSAEELQRTVAMLVNLDAYASPLREFRAMASKKAVIEREFDWSELVESDKYKHQILQDVYDHELPQVLDDLMGDYRALPSARPVFMWKWVHKLAPQNTLPFVEDTYREAIPIDKTLLILYITLLDDALESLNDQATFWQLSKLPREEAKTDPDAHGVDTDYLEFGQRVWELFQDRIRRGPQHETYIDLLRYDIRQAINAIEYTDLVIKQPNLATMEDLVRYESHNMVMFAYADIDLMHSDDHIDSDLSPLREAVWHAQQMARIGNWVSTWEREIREGDVSSGVIVHALEHGIIDHRELAGIRYGEDGSADPLIERIQEHDLEQYFFNLWTDHYKRLEAINEEIEPFDMSPFIEGTEEILRFHLASRGLK